MKTQQILVLALSTLSLACCEEPNLSKFDPKAAKPLIITSFYPESGACGTTLAIYAEGLDASTSESGVTFNGSRAEVMDVRHGKAMVRVPSNLAQGDYVISLTVHGQTATCTKPFRVNGN